MINTTATSSQKNSITFKKLIFLAAIILAGTMMVGFFSANQPLLAAVIALGAIFILASLLWPNIVTLFVIFLIYSNVPAIAVSFHGLPYIAGAFIPFLMVVPLINFVILQRQKLIIPPLFYVVLFFYLIQILATLFTKDIYQGFSSLLKSFVEGILLYIVVINVVRTKEVLHRAVWCLLASGAIIGALGYYQIITRTYDNNYAGFAQVSNAAFSTGEVSLAGDVMQPRLAGPIGEQNRYGQVMLMLVPLGLYVMWGEKKFGLRLLAALLTGTIVLGVATTFSRGAALGFVLALLFMVFMGYIKIKQVLIVGIGIILLFAILPQYGTRLLRLEGLIGLLPGDISSSSSTAPDAALEGRTTSMLTALYVFADHPLIGVGTGMFGYYYQDYAQFVGPRWEVGNRRAHDLYLGLLAENGLLGFISFMAVVLITMRMLAQTRKSLIKNSPLYACIATGFLFAIATYLGTGIGLHFGFYRFFWLIMALAFSATQVATESLPIPESTENRMPDKLILSQIPSSRKTIREL